MADRHWPRQITSSRSDQIPNSGTGSTSSSSVRSFDGNRVPVISEGRPHVRFQALWLIDRYGTGGAEPAAMTTAMTVYSGVRQMFMDARG